MTAPHPTGWQPTAALLRVGLLPLAIAVLAVLARRVDLLVVAAPLAMAALPLLRRPAGRPSAVLTLSDTEVAEGGQLRVGVDVTGAENADTMAVALASGRWVRAPGGATTQAAVPAGTATLGFDLEAARWGRHDVGPAVVTLSAAGGLLRWGPLPLAARRVAVLPLSAAAVGSTMVPRARGHVGLHGSRRAGESPELAGIRPFVAGDRIRRVNWRVSQRTGELHVNDSTSERDADVVLLVDARFDAGVSGGVRGQASGIDVAVRAAGSLSAFYLSLGDRVGLVTVASSVRQLPARGGRSQLHRVLHALLDVSAPTLGGGEAPFPAPVGIDPRALVLLVSPLVGRQVFDRAVALSRAGHAVLVVDTLPPDAGPGSTTVWTASALRLWRLERDSRMVQLRRLGVPLVSWQGSGSLDQALLDLRRATERAGGVR